MGYIAPFPVPGVSPTTPGDIQQGGPLILPRPPFIPAPHCAQVLIRGLQDGEKMEQVIYFHTATGFDDAAVIDQLCDDVATRWGANMIPNLSPTYEFTEVQATALDTATSHNFTLAIEPHVPGARIDDGAPGNLGIGIVTHTGFRGRSNNGRVFITACCDIDFELGVPTDPARTLMLQSYGAFIASLNTLGYSYVLVSYQSAKRWRTIAQVTSIAFMSVGAYIYTQRRRLPGHNRHR
jgi:hypothetical protein